VRDRPSEASMIAPGQHDERVNVGEEDTEGRHLWRAPARAEQGVVETWFLSEPHHGH